jgi:Tfp pilus assembly protein PilF
MAVPTADLARLEVALTLAAGEIEGGFRAAARARLEAALARDPENTALRDLLAKTLEP